ncbi:serine/threonine protein kinase [Methylibium rhizosphaerae]|uniref:serine/threonine protein kinase n=1 Tax=Methylibium rhizosphaerae TaxID=2570323 RepID=UPI00112815BC|nr:serine/threonine-protein kinase [Methylibium rhizosphaerae]
MTQDTPPPEHDALQPGTRLGEFEIQRVLGVGGFGIVYLAFDHALERLVALKEYMPQALAARGQGASVSIRSTSHVETFGVGLRSFVNEAKLLARFDHPSLVKVYRFWEDNGTAYMVMPYYQGRTLRDVRKSMEQPPGEAWLRDLLEPLLGALDVLHKEQVYHRDIAPDNILLLANGQPVLLDFGAARRVIGDRTQTLTAILKPNFAPIEQYAETAGLRQGPWTDLYALGAVMHFCLTGRPPTPAAARAVHDELPTARSVAATLASEAHLHYSDAFVGAIDACLTVRPQGRPENVAALQALLRGEGAQQAGQAASPTAAYAPTQPYSPPRPAAPAEAAHEATVVVPRAPSQPQTAWAPATGAPPLESARPPAEASAGGRRRWPLAALGIVPIVFAGLLWYVTSKPERGPAEVQAAASSPAASAVAMPASAAPAQTVAQAASVAMVAASQATAASAAVAAPASAATPAPGTLLAAAAPTPRPRARPTHEPSGARAEGGEPEPAPRRTPPQQQQQRAENAAVHTPAPQAGPRSPREACGSRVLLALFLCMKRECEKPEFAHHTQCKRVREQEEANQRAYQP